MKVSVIVAAYNAERWLGRCLRSLVEQNFSPDDMEVMVIEDGSTDHTREVLHTFEPQVRTFYHHENLGLPAACNRGIRLARGRYIVRVDADDYVHEEFVRSLYLHMFFNPTADAAACDYWLVDESERPLERRDPVMHPIACGLMFKKDDLVALGLYNESLLIHEDHELRQRFLARHSTILRVALPLYRYRRHDGCGTAYRSWRGRNRSTPSWRTRTR